VKAATMGYRGHLRIALSDGIAQPRLATLFAQCREEEPEVEIRIFEMPFSQQVKGLRSDLLDAGFALASDVGEGLIAELVWTDPIVVAVPARHPLLAHKRIALEAALQYPLILCHPEVCFGCHQQIEGLLRGVDLEPTVADRVASLEVMLTLVGALVVAVTLPSHARSGGASGSGHRHMKLHLPTVPTPNRRHLIFGIAVFAPGITATSFVLSLGPSVLERLLDVRSPLIAGGMACAMFLTASGVQFIVNRLHIRTIFLLGATSTILAMVCLTIAIHASMEVLLIGSALLAGAGQGLGQLGGLTLIATHVPDNHRAEANAVLNIGGYIPAGLLPVATGYLIDAVGLGAGVTAFATVLAIAAALGGGLVFKKLHRD
jgi:hypothetical protein